MKNRETSKDWSVNQGLAAQYAAQASIDPDLAAYAGEAAWDVLKALRDTTEERDPNRKAKRAALTKRRLRKANLSGHRDLVESIHERLVALEDVRPSVNPATGLPEYRFECVEGRNGPCNNVADPIQTLTHRFVYDSSGNIKTNQPSITNYLPSQFTRTPGIGGSGGQLRGGYGTGSGLGIGEGSVYDGNVELDITESAKPSENSQPINEYKPPLPVFDPYGELAASFVPIVGPALVGPALAFRDTINNADSAYHNFTEGDYIGAVDDLGKGAISAVGLVPGAYSVGQTYKLYRMGLIDDVVKDIKFFNDAMTATDPIRDPDKYYYPFAK